MGFHFDAETIGSDIANLSSNKGINKNTFIIGASVLALVGIFVAIKVIKSKSGK